MSNDHAVLNETVAYQDPSAENAESQVEEVEQQGENEESPQQSDDFSKKFAALSRKEKALRDRESEWQNKFQELEARLKEYETAQAAPEEPTKPELPLEYRLKKDPLGTLDELGLSYDKLTQLVVNDGKLPVEDQLNLLQEDISTKFMSKIEELETKLAEKEKMEAEAKMSEAVNGFKSEINTFIESNSEDYELVNASSQQDLIYEVIEAHYEETGKIMDIKEAADAVEEHLLEEATKIAKLNKLSKILPKDESLEPEMKVQSPPTLSNAHAATSSTVAEQRLSDEESKVKAAQILKWTN